VKSAALKVILFVLGTMVLARVSGPALRRSRSHGVYRFLAWEAILALVLWNADHWFRNPLSWHQILSWLLLTVSAFLAIHGVHLLRRLGKPDARRDEPGLIGFEKTTVLVTDGAYKYIRHPMYSSLLFLAWGAFFKAPSWPAGLLVVAATLLLVATARAEEAENVSFFGPPYEEYRQHSKMFVPFLF
jgi:protein-S-isoprenylcysteine O-methyltransferase Ste14